jgi:hypothetical protein
VYAGHLTSPDSTAIAISSIDDTGWVKTDVMGNAIIVCNGKLKPQSKFFLPGRWTNDLLGDVDADGLTELVRGNGQGLEFVKFTGKTVKKSNWPQWVLPAGVADIDGKPGDEIYAIETMLPNQMLLINAREDPESPLHEYAAKLDMDALTLSNINLGPIKDWTKRPANYNLYCATLNANASKARGYIYYPLDDKLIRLRFPGNVRRSNDFRFCSNVVVKASRTSPGILYVSPHEGNSMLGFDHTGRCVYYEEFDESIFPFGVIQTSEGDRMLLQRDNKLYMYP